MAKIISIRKLANEIQLLKKRKKTVALITGCFDVIHLGHIKLFRFAKKHADIVVVGLESDKAIRITKGESRPVNDIRTRLSVLEDIISLDYIFEIRSYVNFNSPECHKGLNKLTKTLLPTFLVTNAYADRYWPEKRKRAKSINASLLLEKRKRKSSSSIQIARIIEKEL